MRREFNLSMILIGFRKHFIVIEWKVSKEEVQNAEQFIYPLIEDSSKDLINLSSIFLNYNWKIFVNCLLFCHLETYDI